MDHLSAQSRRFHRDELRRARARVLADAEAYAEPLHAIERLGRHLKPKARALGKAAKALSKLAAASPLGHQLPDRWRQFHAPFPELLDTLRDYRNDVMHVGARARHLTGHAVEVCLVLEDALEDGLSTVGDFMVRNPVTAERWQPVSFLRRQMLKYSFTFIPLEPDETESCWRLVADHHLARYLGGRNKPKARLNRLSNTVGDALTEGLETVPAALVDASVSIADLRDELSDHPRLVQSSGRVVGIITAFDML